MSGLKRICTFSLVRHMSGVGKGINEIGKPHSVGNSVSFMPLSTIVIMNSVHMSGFLKMHSLSIMDKHRCML